MPKIRLPKLTKTMHESQIKWREENWNYTLKQHKKEIEKLLEKIGVLDIWSNALQGNEVANELIPEIFMDAYLSIHLACYGLYKYAHVCLRSELETVLRLVFFATHKVEFEWWRNGNEWYKENVTGDVWGRGYTYFEQLNTIKKFDNMCTNDKKLFGGKYIGVKGIYKTLSKSTHSSAGYFQTKPDRVSPKYQMNEFKKWISTSKKVQEYINILIPLGFSQEFRNLNESDNKKVIETGIELSDYRKYLKQIVDDS